MRKFSLLSVLFLIAVFAFGCNKTVNIEPKEPVYDRDLCGRCKMQLADRLHSAQIVNPEDGSVLFFDDLGCAVLWLEETAPLWKDNAILYITDGTDGKWIEHKNAFYASGYKTPMSFGIAAFDDKGKITGNKVITYDEAVQIIKDIKAARTHNKK